MNRFPGGTIQHAGMAKRGNATTILEAILARAEASEGGTSLPLPCPPPEAIDGIPAAADLIVRCALQGDMPVVIVGDYDADGVTATAILVKLLHHFGVSPRAIIPRRFTNGYGITHSPGGGHLPFPPHHRGQRHCRRGTHPGCQGGGECGVDPRPPSAPGRDSPRRRHRGPPPASGTETGMSTIAAPGWPINWPSTCAGRRLPRRKRSAFSTCWCWPAWVPWPM